LFFFLFDSMCPSVFSSSSTGINIQFGHFGLLNVFLHIEYNSKIHDIIKLLLLRDIIRLFDSSPYPLILLFSFPLILLLFR
jgi:hypothetical protein